MKRINQYYHASPLNNLDKIGISPKSSPLVSKEPQGYVYLGPIEYMDEYFSYAPEGTYTIYEVNINGLPIDSNLPAGQIRTKEFISPDRVKPVDRKYTAPEKHPREKEYLEWMKELGKE